jgi:hypothetical protein
LGESQYELSLNQKFMRLRFQSKTRVKCTGGATQAIKCLLWKHKDLSSNPSPTKKPKKNISRFSKIASNYIWPFCLQDCAFLPSILCFPSLQRDKDLIKECMCLCTFMSLFVCMCVCVFGQGNKSISTNICIYGCVILYVTKNCSIIIQRDFMVILTYTHIMHIDQIHCLYCSFWTPSLFPSFLRDFNSFHAISMHMYNVPFSYLPLSSSPFTTHWFPLAKQSLSYTHVTLLLIFRSRLCIEQKYAILSFWTYLT